MNTSIKRIAAVGSMFALVAVSGCSSLDVTVATDDQGYSVPGSTDNNDILKQMGADSSRGE
jgi:hypothetical protein